MQASKQADKLSANNLMVVLMLVSLIIVGATALVAKTLIVGLIRDSKVLSAENKANNTLKEDLKNAPLLVSAYQGLGPKANLLADALPVDSNFPSIIVAIENMSRDSALSLKNVAPAFNPSAAVGTAGASGSGIDAPKPSLYNFSLNFDGSYISVQKMLGDLETYDRPIRVKGLKLSGNGTSLSGTIDVETYYQAKAKLPVSQETIK